MRRLRRRRTGAGAGAGADAVVMMVLPVPVIGIGAGADLAAPVLRRSTTSMLTASLWLVPRIVLVMPRAILALLPRRARIRPPSSGSSSR